MMAPAGNDATEQVKFLVACIKHSSSGKIDFGQVAIECQIVSKAAAAKRYERLMKAPGITSSGNGAGVSASPTPTDKNKTPGKGKGKTTSTQTPKKRKLDAVVDDDDDETARSATKSEALKMEKGNSIENKYSNDNA